MGAPEESVYRKVWADVYFGAGVPKPVAAGTDGRRSSPDPSAPGTDTLDRPLS